MPTSFTFVQCNIQRASGRWAKDRLTGLRKHIAAVKPDFLFLQETGTDDYLIQDYVLVHTTQNPKLRKADGSVFGDSQLNIQVYRRTNSQLVARNAKDEVIDTQRRKCLCFDVDNGNETIPVRVYHANASLGGGINAVNHAYQHAENNRTSLHVGDFNLDLNALQDRIDKGLADAEVFDRIAAARDGNGALLATHKKGGVLDYAVHGDNVSVTYEEPKASSFGHPKFPHEYETRTVPDDKRKDPVDHYMMTGRAELKASPIFATPAPLNPGKKAARISAIEDLVRDKEAEIRQATKVPRQHFKSVEAAKNFVIEATRRAGPIITPKENRAFMTIIRKLKNRPKKPGIAPIRSRSERRAGF